jgi:hypothetical protein
MLRGIRRKKCLAQLNPHLCVLRSLAQCLAMPAVRNANVYTFRGTGAMCRIMRSAALALIAFVISGCVATSMQGYADRERAMRRFYLVGLAILALALIRPSFSTAADISCIESADGAIAIEPLPNDIIWPDESIAKDPKRHLEYLDYWAKAYPSGRRPNRECGDILIAGPIVSGDAVKFADFVRRNRPFLHRVTLWSSGGSVEEAIRIGHIIRKNLLSTRAPAAGWGGGRGSLVYSYSPKVIYCEGYDCHCASACFLIWAAGYKRSGYALGIHQPTSTSTTFSNMPPDRASVLYRQLISDIDRYLTEMEMPRRFIEMIINTPSNDIRWLSLSEASALSDVPSFEEWLGASCGKSGPCRALKLMRARDAISSPYASGSGVIEPAN